MGRQCSPPIYLYLFAIVLSIYVFSFHFVKANEEKEFAGLVAPFARRIFENPGATPEVHRIGWAVSVKCVGCASAEAEHTTEVDGNGRFRVKLKEPADGKITGVHVKLESKEPLAGHKRSYTWYVEPNFGHVLLFQFGHFHRSAWDSFYLQAKFKEAWPALEHHEFAGYMARLESEDKQKIFSHTMLTEEEWKGAAKFMMKFKKEEIMDYWAKHPMPSMHFYIYKVPICGICNKQVENGEKEIFKLKTRSSQPAEYFHIICHYRRTYPGKPQSHACENHDCKGCRKKREKHGKDYFNSHDKIGEHELFHAHLKMPIVQNGDQPHYVYEFPTKNAEDPEHNYNRHELMPEAAASSSSAGPSNSKSAPAAGTSDTKSKGKEPEQSTPVGAAGHAPSDEPVWHPEHEDVGLQEMLLASFHKPEPAAQTQPAAATQPELAVEHHPEWEEHEDVQAALFAQFERPPEPVQSAQPAPPSPRVEQPEQPLMYEYPQQQQQQGGGNWIDTFLEGFSENYGDGTYVRHRHWGQQP